MPAGRENAAPPVVIRDAGITPVGMEYLDAAVDVTNFSRERDESISNKDVSRGVCTNTVRIRGMLFRPWYQDCV